MSTPRYNSDSLSLLGPSLQGFCPELLHGTLINIKGCSASLFTLFFGRRVIVWYRLPTLKSGNLSRWQGNFRVCQELLRDLGIPIYPSLQMWLTSINLLRRIYKGLGLILLYPARLELTSDWLNQHHWLKNRSIMIL